MCAILLHIRVTLVMAISSTCLMLVSVHVTAGEGSAGSEEGSRQALTFTQMPVEWSGVGRRLNLIIRKKSGLHFIGFEFDFSRSSFYFILWRSWSMMGENYPPESLRSSSLTSFLQGVNGFRKSEISTRTMLRPQTQWTHPPAAPLPVPVLMKSSSSLPLSSHRDEISASASERLAAQERGPQAHFYHF